MKWEVLDRTEVRLGVSVLWRLLNAFQTTTFFQPDEFFQSWEVAHSDVYGVGFRTWEWHAGIRTSLMPLFFSAIIRGAQVLNMDYLILGKVIMTVMAGLADVCTGRLADQWGSRRTGRTTWILSLLSFFNWYCSTRPFSNTFEMVLVVISLTLWYSRSATMRALAQALAHFSIALRPSVAIFWLMLGVDLLARARTWQKRVLVCASSLATALVTQGAITLIDAWYYEGATIPHIQFLKYNFGAKISEIYGVNPWHWYVSQGLPFMLLGYLPLVLCGWRAAAWKIKAFIALNVLAFSAIPHKEFRFLYFLLPLLHYIAALGVSKVAPMVLIAGFMLNGLAGVYFASFHQRGVMDVVQHISETRDISDISFLMPCHSTPWQAHFQRRHDSAFRPQFLTCDPPWNVSSQGYVDEADQFYLEPAEFLRAHPEKLVDTVVIFEPLAPLMSELGYSPIKRFSNGFFNEDSRRRGDVILMQKVEAGNTTSS